MILIYQFKVNGKSISLFHGIRLIISNALKIYTYSNYTIIEKAVDIPWTRIESDIALYRLLKKISMKIKSKLTLIDTGEIQSPFYRLVIKTVNAQHLNQIINSTTICIDGLMAAKYWYLRLITQARDVQCLPFKHISNGYEALNNELKVHINFSKSILFTSIRFTWDEDGEYLENINDVARYALDLFWNMKENVQTQMNILNSINDIVITLFNNKLDPLEYINNFIEKHPLKVAF